MTVIDGTTSVYYGAPFELDTKTKDGKPSKRLRLVAPTQHFILIENQKIAENLCAAILAHFDAREAAGSPLPQRRPSFEVSALDGRVRITRGKHRIFIAEDEAHDLADALVDAVEAGNDG